MIVAGEAHHVAKPGEILHQLLRPEVEPGHPVAQPSSQKLRLGDTEGRRRIARTHIRRTFLQCRKSPGNLRRIRRATLACNAHRHLFSPYQFTV